MGISIGVDVAKEKHWVTTLAEGGEIVFERAVFNTPGDVARLLEEIAQLKGERTVGLDVVGGIASLLSAMLIDAGERVVHVPGLAVNRARQGTTGGENKSDPKDARIIADQVRTRRDLRPLKHRGEAELALLVSHRRELVQDQTRRIGRLHDLLVTIHPGLEHRLDLTTKGALHLLSRYVTPAEIRRAGRNGLLRHMRRGKNLPRPEDLVERALEAAQEQSFALPAEITAARFVRELAADALTTRERLLALDAELQEAVHRHPDGALILSLPGMGVVLTAEFLVEAGPLEYFSGPDALAAAGGVAPVIRQSGKVRFFRRPLGGNKALKRVFYQSAFCSLSQPDSRAFYERKRSEGKSHHQAVLALARRRVNVLWAILRDREPYELRLPTAEAA